MHTGTLRRRLMRIAVTTTMLSLLSIGGCALPERLDPEDAEYRRIDAQLRAADEFEALKRSCRARGGVVFVDGSSSRLQRQSADLAGARCRAPLPAFRF